MVKITNKKEAIKNGLKQSTLDLVKEIPLMSTLIEGVSAYQENIQEQQKEKFILNLNEKVKYLEKKFDKNWYKSKEGQEIAKKIFSSALNAEYNDKIDYFVNALINSPNIADQSEKLKFIEILRNISKPALKVLAKEYKLYQEQNNYRTNEVRVQELSSKINMSNKLIDSCITELYNLGVFSSVSEFTKNGNKKSYLRRGTPGFTDFTEKFIRYISDPRKEIELTGGI